MSAPKLPASLQAMSAQLDTILKRLFDQIEIRDKRVAEFERALNSIANNSCCGDCQEAKRVAIAALKEKPE